MLKKTARLSSCILADSIILEDILPVKPSKKAIIINTKLIITEKPITGKKLSLPSLKKVPKENLLSV